MAYFPSAHRLPVDKTVLCVELEHKWMRAAILPSPITKESLRDLKPIEALSTPWLMNNIEKLFEISEENPLNDLLKEKISTLSLSIFGPLYQNGENHCKTQMVPQNLLQHLKDHTQAKVSVEVDVVAWAIGALEYLRLDSKTLQYPALVVSLGTGVGMALIESETSVKAVEYSTMNCPFPRLRLLNERIYVLNLTYLTEISGGDIEGKMETYRSTYNRDFKALVLDMTEYLEKEYSTGPIKSVVVGGGFSRYIDNLEGIPLESFLFSPQYLEKEHVSPYSIQLLGCLRKSQEPTLVTDTLPDIDTLLKVFKPKPQ